MEHLLALEGLPPAGSAADSSPASKVPPSLLEEVFALNEELDEIRDLRESGGDAAALHARLDAARKPIEGKREEDERQLQELSARWDMQPWLRRRRISDVDSLRDRLLAATTSHCSQPWNGCREIVIGMAKGTHHESRFTSPDWGAVGRSFASISHTNASSPTYRAAVRRDRDDSGDCPSLRSCLFRILPDRRLP